MEVKKDFNTFKPGDIVRVKPGFPYVNRVLLDGEIYIIDKMLADAIKFGRGNAHLDTVFIGNHIGKWNGLFGVFILEGYFNGAVIVLR